jgi:hypothetical protein
MVHTWLLSKARGKILTGSILVFVLGPIFFTYIIAKPIEFGIGLNPLGFPPELRLLALLESRARIGASIGGIGIFFLIVGIGYLLAAFLLEYNKKRRHAHRSKI